MTKVRHVHRFHRNAGGQQRDLGIAGAMDRNLAIRLTMHDQDRCGVLALGRQRLRRDQGARADGAGGVGWCVAFSWEEQRSEKKIRDQETEIRDQETEIRDPGRVSASDL